MPPRWVCDGQDLTRGGGRRLYLLLKRVLYGSISLDSINNMPRKKTIQPAPLHTFTTDNGIVAEVRDYATREIGPGLDKKFIAEELDWQVLNGIFDDLMSNSAVRVSRANTALESNHAMERYLNVGDYGLEERTGRRHGKSIRKKYNQMRQIVGIVEYESWAVHSAPSSNTME